MSSAATIAEIAKLANVSVSTVSKALNGYPHVSEKTRAKILDIAKKNGFSPNFFARSLLKKRSYLIGALINGMWGDSLLHPLFAGVIAGFKQAAESAGYELLLMKNEYISEGEKAVSHCQKRGIEGVFVVVASSGDPGVWQIVESGIPCVSVDLFGDKLSSVLSDNVEGGFIATEYLIKLGHKKIVHIAGNDDKPAGRDRLKGYMLALEKYGIEYDEGLVKKSQYYLSDEGREFALMIIDEKTEFSAVFAASDTLAFGVISACRERGLDVPRDVSVVGFDDIEAAAYFSPPLTTMRQNRLEIGRVASETLIGLIENTENSEVYHKTLSADLIVRESTAEGKSV